MLQTYDGHKSDNFDSHKEPIVKDQGAIGWAIGEGTLPWSIFCATPGRDKHKESKQARNNNKKGCVWEKAEVSNL